MTIPIKQCLLLSVCALASAAHANGFVLNKAGDEVLDASNGWVWKRCSVGQTWNGTSCTGTAQGFTFDQAQAQGGSGWRVPTVRQLASLVYCSSGQTQRNQDPKDGGPAIAHLCGGSFSKPTINTTVFPGTADSAYWSSSPSVGNPSYYAWGVHFYNGNVNDYYRYDLNHVRLVRASQLLGSEAASAFVGPVAWALGNSMEQSLGSVPLSWEPKSTGKPLALPSNAPTVDLQNTASSIKAIALADVHQAPAQVVGAVSPPNLVAPVRQVVQPRQVSIPPKDEFETTAAFDARKQRAYQEAQQADQAAKDSAEQAYQSAVRAFNTAQLTFNQQQAKQEADNAAARAQAEARKTDPNAYRSALLKAWDIVTNASLGDPVLQDVAYDADRQVFTAKLLSSYGLLVGDVTAPVPLAQAPAFKADLLSGKIAPKVTFAYPSMRLEWALIENSAQRSARFAAAQNSIDQLEALMREFPNAPEVAAARRRVQALIAQEFAKASTSSQLQAVLNKYPSAAEAPAARQRVEQLRLAEQRAEREAQEAQRRAEREAQEAARRQREWENSPQGQAQRQARQVCEAQKASCFSQCGESSYWNGSRYVDNQSWSGCRITCSSISCN